MNNDEFLDELPFYQGVAWSAMTGERERNEVRALGARMFWLHPKYFALAQLAREHGERFAELVRECEKTSCERYNAPDWASAEPTDGTKLVAANVLREYLAMLESKG